MGGSKQLELFNNLRAKKIFGGSLLKNGHAREARPLSTKKPIHLVLRSTLARGEYSFLKGHHAKSLRLIVQRQAQRAGVKLYRFANSGNHLHLLILPRSRSGFNRFVRAVTGIIARYILGAERGNPTKHEKFWDFRPFTRIVQWGKDYKRVHRYLTLNILESLGAFPEMTEQELIRFFG